ncbi:YaeQ family protein [Parvibium lacunae]|uniref:YaeQ family protein n=1 Tax=Parvibium lacunae TaxID=1888893 RepID=A0A368KYZ1_9BURK|nr:YaeQ family protein [Parvibium lacunae]RCS56606.1 hypothetical protein DU000_11635 [Parvibium lacunae]
MALKATIYKATLSIADMDRGYYADHAITLARHPSETEERLMVRVLAFACYAHEYLSFTKGLSDVDEPDLWQKDLTGTIDCWIDVGQPDESRIRKACARASQVVVLAYSHSADIWWKGMADKVARFAHLTVWQLAPEHSQALAALAARNMSLQCTVQEGQIWLSNQETTVALNLHTLKTPNEKE